MERRFASPKRRTDKSDPRRSDTTVANPVLRQSDPRIGLHNCRRSDSAGMRFHQNPRERFGGRAHTCMQADLTWLHQGIVKGGLHQNLRSFPLQNIHPMASTNAGSAITESELAILSAQELILEAKAIKSFSIQNAFMVGFFAGIVIYSLIISHFGWFLLIPLYLIHKFVHQPNARHAR